MPNEPEISFEQPRSGFGAWFGIVLLFSVFGLFVWAVMGMVPRGDTYEKKRAEARMEKLKAVRDEADKSLHGYAWVDKEKGVVKLPIDRAMELTMADLAKKKPTVAYPIPPEGAAPADQAAPGAPTPAPSPAASPAKGAAGKDIEGRDKAPAPQNPPNAAPGSQPGASATPAASPGKKP